RGRSPTRRCRTGWRGLTTTADVRNIQLISHRKMALISIPERSPAPTGKRIQSADRVVDILEFLAGTDQGRASLSQVSVALGLQPSTAHHLLATLRARRLIAQDAATRQYSLGERLIELGQSALRSVDLVALVRPAVHALHAATGQNSCYVAFRGCHRCLLVREAADG